MQFNKPILIYIPCYNCESWIVETLCSIPPELHDQMECLVIDNHSTDRTGERVLEVIKEGKLPFKISLIQTKENIGYAGSQKLAYHLATNSSDIKNVIMLHGDGQYCSSLLTKFMSHINNDYAIVNGYRDKKTYPHQEATPFASYIIIKMLNFLEYLITGYAQKEWHSGFVMYRKEFLSNISLQLLSDTRHIDGELLICAGILKENTLSVPIYKRYNDYEGLNRITKAKNVLNVLRIMWKCKKANDHRIL